MTKNEFKIAYPSLYEYYNSLPIVHHPEGLGRLDKRTGRFQVYTGVMLKCGCSNCTTPNEYHFVRKSNLYQDAYHDGKYHCYSCRTRDTIVSRSKKMDFSSAARKREDNLGVEGRSDRSRKAMETMGPGGLRDRAMKVASVVDHSIKVRKGQKTLKDAGYSDSEAWREHQSKVAETKTLNGTWWRSPWEVWIDKNFGTVHGGHGETHDGVYFKYEIDCYWDGLKKGIELDTPDHEFKDKDYHKKKIEYFRQYGIEILFISEGNANPVRRPGYKDMFEVITAFKEGTLPEEYYIMWEDKHHTNG